MLPYRAVVVGETFLMRNDVYASKLTRRPRKWRGYRVALVAAAVLAVGATVVCAGCGQPARYERSAYVLDTALTITIVDVRPTTQRDVEEALAYARSLASYVDYYDPESEISRLNARIASADAFPATISCSATLGAIIETAVEVAKVSDGYYDPTVGALTDAWSFNTGGRLPRPDEITEALRTVGYERISVAPDRRAIRADGVTRIDPGGISKGWAIDRIARFLEKKGYRHFLINGVSSTVARGNRYRVSRVRGSEDVEGAADGEPFRVGIEHPRGKGLMAVVRLQGGETISTSGDYQRYFIHDGKRYHHILDPHTGYPAEGFRSVTIVAPLPAAVTDALSTAVFAMGKERGIAFVKEHARTLGIKMIAMDKTGKIVFVPEGEWVEVEPPRGAR